MSLPSLTHCGELLDQASEVLWSATFNREGGPADRAIAAREMAKDVELGDEEFPHPFGTTYWLIQALLWSTGERLATLQWTVKAEPIPHLLSSYELARSAAEASATAGWLANPSIGAKARLGRMLGYMKSSDDHEQSLRRVAPDLSMTDERLGLAAVEWGERRGIKRAKYHQLTSLLTKVANNTGQVDYKRLSAIAHGRASATLAAHMAVVDAQEHDDMTTVVGATWMPSLAAVRYSMSAVMLRNELYGVDNGAANRVVSRLSVLRAAVESGPTRY